MWSPTVSHSVLMMMYGCDMAAVTQKKLVNITMLRRAAARQREAVTSGMEELHSRRATEVLKGNVVWVCFSFFCSIQQGLAAQLLKPQKHFLKKKKKNQLAFLFEAEVHFFT